jgi:two-component system, NarL family, response regulator NreC
MTAPGRDTRIIRVLLVDDHPVVTEGLRLLLESRANFDVVGEAASLEEAVADDNVPPDVIVTDLMLGDASGATVVKSLSLRFGKAPVLVFTMVEDPTEIEKAIGAGARGYVLKGTAPDDVIDAVRRVARGEEYVQPSVGAMLGRRAATRANSEGGPASQLSERELEVVRLIVLGHTNSEIAALLSLSMRTVETHRAHIVDKLGVRTRAELVRRALDLGLADLSS